MLNHDFVIRTNCASLPFVLNNTIKNATAKGKFSKWKALFSCYNYSVEHMSRKSNCIPDFLTIGYLVNKYDVKKNLWSEQSMRKRSSNKRVHRKRTRVKKAPEKESEPEASGPITHKLT